MSEWTNVAPTAEFAIGSYQVIEVDGAIIAVFNVDGAFYAIEDVCTHDGGTLTGGKVCGDRITCPRHGAVFSIKTGEVLAPPAYEPVHRFPVRIERGTVQVRDDRWN